MDSTGSYRRSSRKLPATPVHGFDTQLISLEKMVQQRQSSDQFKAVAIVGKRGVGKTTLCQKLFSKYSEVQPAKFLPRIWVCMSRKPTEYIDCKTTVKRMLTCLGVDDETIHSISDSEPEGDRLSRLLYALHLQLTGKKYLIVLDDASAKDEWFANLDSPITDKEKWGKFLAFGLPKGHGGTVIVTSRVENVAKMMVGEKNLLHLLPLSDPKSCSSIFNDHIKKGKKLEYDPERKEFLKKCSGLPLAAKMMGNIKSEELEKAEREAEKKEAAEEPESPSSSNPTQPKPIQRDEAAKSSEDDEKIKSEVVPAGEKLIQQEEKDERSSIGIKDDEQNKSEEHPAEAEARPHQGGAAHNEIH